MNTAIPVLEVIPVDHFVWLSAILFSIGVAGVLMRRNSIVLLMCIELMLNAVNLLFTAFSTYLGDEAGQIMVFFIMVVAAAEASIGLAILVMIYRNHKTVDVSFLDKLRG